MKNKSVLFVFRRNRGKMLREWQIGEGPCEFLYGMPFLAEEGFKVDFIEGDDNSKNWKRMLCLPLEYFISQRVKIGFGLHIPWINWQKILQADVIVSTVDTCGLPLAMLKYLGRLPQPIIYISQGLADRVDILSDNMINHFIIEKYRKWLSSAECVLVLGEGAVGSVQNTFNLSAERVSCLPFGVDDAFWSPGNRKQSEDYILSIGSDQGRDYETLIKAIDNYPIRVITRLNLSYNPELANITVNSDYNNLELREIYRNSRFVVIPLKDITQPSGQSATLQAMSCGKAVILTKTSGLWDTSLMRHGENCLLVTPGDHEELNRAITYLWNHPEISGRIGQLARETVEKFFSQKLFGKKLSQCINNLTEERLIN